MLIILLFICVCIIFIERKRQKSFVSPAILAALSTMVGVLFAHIGYLFYDFYPISDSVYMIYSVCLIIFSIPSLFFQNNILSINTISKQSKIDIKCAILYLILFVCAILHLIKNLKYGNVGSEEFEANYSRGLGAHTLNLLIVLVTYSLLFHKKNLLMLLFIGISFVFIFLSGTKYHILFILAAYLLKYLHKQKRFSEILKLCAYIGVLGFLFFTLNYFVGFLLRGSNMDGFVKFAIGHFAKYIGGGFIALGRVLDGNFVTPHILGSDSELLDDLYVAVSATIEETTNVYTLFGYFLLKYGYFPMFSIVWILGWIAHTLYNAMSNRYFFLFYSFITGIELFMTFFSPYWKLLNVWEWAIYSIFLKMLLTANFKFPKTNESQNQAVCTIS